ncbi:lysoplasmalogenase [Flagellimonas meishanensis]|uniref:lysoplasmalogenase n=1 Tax=Flagellimonas meishanensis TaxID=2873264 RepID=UPI001CA72D2A|nr:lysoplasmalogenase [[Muricauda] meishanensis]
MVVQNHRIQVVLNMLAALSGGIAIYLELIGNASGYALFKPLTTILILSLLFLTPKTNRTNLWNMVLAALVFCLLGDILLLWPAYFVFGLASFSVAHLLFASVFIKLERFQFQGMALIVFFGIGTGLFLWLKQDLGDLMIPVALYVMVIVFMAWRGASLYLTQRKKAYAWIGLAVLLFMFSDTLIAIDKFKTQLYWSAPVILATYWFSIGLIANAFLKLISERKQR